MANGADINWPDSVWQEINDAVVAEVGRVRTAQMVFPTTMLDGDPTEVMNDVIDIENNTIKEGQTKQIVELYKTFELTATQVSREAQLKTCKTLARMAAKMIALAEDRVIFHGNEPDPAAVAAAAAAAAAAEAARAGAEAARAAAAAAVPSKLPGGVVAERRESAGKGLWGIAAEDTDPAREEKGVPPIPVPLAPARGGPPRRVQWGEETFKAVTKGIASLTQKGQAPKFALFLPVSAYADTFAPPGDQSLVTTAERIKPLVEGGFVEAVSLWDKKGLLVALAGDPTSIYVGREATAEFIKKEGSKYTFRVVERVQFVARDRRALVQLNFE